jgi:hypothetical protein
LEFGGSARPPQLGKTVGSDYEKLVFELVRETGHDLSEVAAWFTIGINPRKAASAALRSRDGGGVAFSFTVHDRALLKQALYRQHKRLRIRARGIHRTGELLWIELREFRIAIGKEHVFLIPEGPGADDLVKLQSDRANGPRLAKRAGFRAAMAAAQAHPHQLRAYLNPVACWEGLRSFGLPPSAEARIKRECQWLAISLNGQGDGITLRTDLGLTKDSILRRLFRPSTGRSSWIDALDTQPLAAVNATLDPTEILPVAKAVGLHLQAATELLGLPSARAGAVGRSAL